MSEFPRWALQLRRRRARGALLAALLVGREACAASAALASGGGENRSAAQSPEVEVELQEDGLVRGRRLPIGNDPTGATLGVKANCKGPNCIESQRWDCFFALEGDGSVQNCIFNWKDDGPRPGWSVVAGDRSKVTWSDPWGPDSLTLAGQLQNGDLSIDSKECGVGKPYTWPIFDMSMTGDMLVADTLTVATLPPVRSNQTAPFTLAACYCASFDIDPVDQSAFCVGNLGPASDRCCSKYQEYAETVGVVYYWTMRICDMSNFAGTRSIGSSAGCASPYRRVLPHQQFVVRVECPPGGGCKGGDNNLIKFIEGGPSYPDNDLPSWMDSHPCNVAAEPPSVVWPTVTATETLSGGTRVDYKVWSQQRPKLNKGVGQQVDVCFSNTNLPKYYVKVGSVKTSTAFAIASRFPGHFDPANTVNISTVRYAGRNGSFTLYGGISDSQPSPYDSNSFSGKALAYFMSYDRETLWGLGSTQQTLEKYLNLDASMPPTMQTLLDTECRRYRLSNFLASPNPLPMAQVAGGDASNSRYHTFSGINQRNFIKVNLAGVVAVCYCAMVGDNNQCDPANWYFASRITIQGPTGGQNWEFDTLIVVKLAVTGWGLSGNDRLRIIGSGSACSDLAGSPSGDGSFKIACPASGGVGCTYAGAATDITLNAMSWQNSGLTVSSVQVFDTYSYLTFSGNIQGLLMPRDIITMDYGSVAINGKVQGQETPGEKYEMYRLSGEYTFQDTLRAGETVQRYLVGHRVSTVDIDGDGIPEPNRLSIPIGWPIANRPTFSFPPGGGLPGGRWVRRNLVQTAEEIKGMTATTSDLKVCWGVNENGGTTYYQQAGTIKFRTPAAMPTAKVFLTTKQVGAIAPAVIFFKTDPSRTQYATVSGKTKLMLRFLDVRDTEGKLVPVFAQDTSYTCPDNGGCPDEIPGDSEVVYSNARQFQCGKLFSELWSDDLEGFPVPLGCYYSKKLLDGPNPSDALTANSNLFFREITIVFRAENGLRANTRYMLVLNTRNPTAMNPTSATIPIVDLYAMCAEDTGCDRPYMVIERGAASLAATSQTVPGGTLNDPRLGQGGLEIQSADGTGTLSLSDLNILQMKLMGGSGQRAIRAQAIIRLYLWPLTSWSIGDASCTARCLPYYASSAAQCSGPVGCKPEAVVDPKLNNAYNAIRITLPSTMTDITETTQHTIQIFSLSLPRGGFFPTRLGVQLTKDDDSAPQYTTSKGFIFKYPEAGQTEGRLVLTDRTGYGPKPFAQDKDNKLVIRLQFGATLWNWGETGLASMFEVKLPQGYTCGVATTDNGEPPATLPVFLADSNGDGFPDNNRGILGVNSDDGDWLRSSSQSCFYELKKWNRIYERQVVYVQLTVQNPANSFQRGDPTNYWQVQLSSKGADSNSLTPGGRSMPYVLFNNNSQILLSKDPNMVKFFTGNAAVIKELVLPLFQPASTTYSMARSCCGTSFDQRRSTQFLRVFFTPGVSVGQRGYVVVDAPDGFDFGLACVVKDLSADYYAYAGDQEIQLKPLQPPLICTGSMYPMTARTYNRASIWVTGSIDVQPLQTYGFQVQVTHPTTYDVTQQSDGWRLWTQDNMGYALEGSRTTVKFNPKQAPTQTMFYHMSWGLYADAETGFPLVQIANLQPYAIANNQDSMVVIYPIMFTQTVSTSLRITAPLDFVWNTDMANYKPNTNCTNSAPCENFGGGAAGVVPQIEGTVNNALVWTSLSFNANVRYGFQHKIRVPSHNPRVSANSFFFEYGFDRTAIADRLRAAAVEAPRVAALVNCKVGYNSNQVGLTDNRMQFQLETITTIPLNGGIVIAGDQNTKGFTFVPQFTMLDGSAAFPPDVSILAVKQADGTPQIMIKVQSNLIAPGLYRFEMQVANPTQRVLTAGLWTFGTYKDVSNYPDKKYLDKEMVAPGFVINRRMQYAGFYPLNSRQADATDREDRPGYINNLVFAFELATRPTDPQNSQMVLKAPNGFSFEDDCLGSVANPKLLTSQNTVFGPNTGGIFPFTDGVTPWPGVYSPTACKGNGRDAVISIPVGGLLPSTRYVFRIRVQNPMRSPSWNKWTISYNSESSDPFSGFSIWTSVGTPTVQPVSYSRSQGGSANPITNPVVITFRPYKTVPMKPADRPKGGCVRVEAPAGFIFVNVNLQCNVDLSVTGSADSVPSSQLQCEVDPSLTKLNVYMIGNTQITGDEPPGPGSEYRLIVYVYNPTQPQAAADWQLNTFSRYTREPDYSLDESTIRGFAISNDLWTFTVTNMLQQFNGNLPVTDVELVLNFRDPIKDGDNITLYSPTGFNIVENPDLGSCKNYRPVGVSPDWFPYTGPPKCRCDIFGPACRLFWSPIKEGKDPAFPQKQDIRFRIATVNPSKTPTVMANFWRVQHFSSLKVLLAAQVARSWDIKPQLAAVAIKFADTFRSAGSQANLDFTFTPINSGCCISIEATFPTQFDFTQSTVAPNYDILRQDGATITVNLRSPGLVAGLPTTLRVYNVKLGRGGGNTRFNLVSYGDDKLTVRMDESLDFTGGFRLPGVVAVIGTPTLTSMWKESQLLYPVKSLFRPRVGEWATAQFMLTFSQPVYSQGRLVISCAGAGSSKGYTLKADNFLVIGTGQIDAAPSIDAASGSLQAVLKGGRPATEVALQVDTPYTVSLRVFPASDGANTWRFDTFDAMGATNTNNGDSQGFSPVQNFLLSVTATRSPPKSTVLVTLDIDQGTAVVRELVIIAPAGFSFDAGSEGCGDMCTPGQALGSSDRATATLASPTGQPLTRLKGLKIRVVAPEQTPIGSGSEGIMWFVEGRGQGPGDVKGWGQGSGFSVTQMSGSAVFYAGVSNARATQIAFSFALDVDAGSTIQIVPPAGVLLTCSLEGSLRTLSLPGTRPNCIDDPMQLQLQSPLSSGTYAFVVTADLPAQTPSPNTFDIIIQDQYNNVVDAAYGIQGEDIVDIAAEAPTLSWSRADPGQPSMVTVGIDFTRPTHSIQALLFTLPELFQHDVQIAIDVQNLNKRFPLAAGLNWADTSEPDRIKVFLDDNVNGDSTTIPVDRYRWSFPVLVPPAMPRKNLWFISLCSDRTCKQPSDKQVIVSFPMAGFNLYELVPEGLRIAASSARRRSGPASSALALGVAALLALRARWGC